MRLFCTPMSLFISSLNSGSNGNCYYIGNEHEAVLIDAGISCRETEKRIRRLGLSMEKVKAIFISHEHGDHISGVEGLSKKHQLPVYVTAPARHHGRLKIGEQFARDFKAYEPVQIGALSVNAFPKLHDAADPFSFVVEGGGVKIGVFTDIGVPCTHLIRSFGQCHAAFLEANYDEAMLEQGTYPQHLKNRIRGGKGHLSNTQALELFTTYRPAFMTHLLLSHLSKNNNRPELVDRLFSAHANGVHIVVASRYKETDVFKIDSAQIEPYVAAPRLQQQKIVQASLF
jgi:phosphoribosyl 1,2-cyclic phosphodiesterase